jgi:hypothetical protein
MCVLLIVYFRVLSAITSEFAERTLFSQISTSLKMNNLTPRWCCLILIRKKQTHHISACQLSENGITTSPQQLPFC